MSYPISKLFWFDRKAESKLDTWNVGATGPHAITERLRYICPEDKIGMVEHLLARANRDSAAGSVGYAGCSWDLRINALEYTLLLAGFTNNTVDYMRDAQLQNPLILFEGDQLAGYSVDLSDSGTVSYLLSYKITEFEALEKIEIELPIEPAKKDIQQPEEKPWWWPF